MIKVYSAWTVDAKRDYNRALNMRDTDPEQALRLLQHVKNRLSPFDQYYKRADTLILEIKRKQSS